MIMRMFSHTKAYQTLVIEDYHPTRNDALQVQVSINEDGTALVLNVLNRCENDDEVELDLSAFYVPDGEVKGEGLIADDLLSMNTLGDRQIRELACPLTVENRIAKCAAPKLSYTEYVIGLERPVRA